MSGTYQDELPNSYQVADDTPPAGTTIEDVELIDFATGQSLVDPTGATLTSPTVLTQVLVDNCTPVVLTNDEEYPAPTQVTNQQESEVSMSLLGVPRTTRALSLFDSVNIYGVNAKDWEASATYTYSRDPLGYTFSGDYGNFTRHLPNQSAIQAYVYPPPASFTFPFDDGSGRFPGGRTDGVMTAWWQSRQAFRYQPGRISGFTLGVRVSTASGHSGEVIQWGCRNKYGDGYYFQLEQGTDLYIVRTSPLLGTIKVAQSNWNGDTLLAGSTQTDWTLDLSRVTMFKIEFSWYGAIGATFLAYVPVGAGEARWVKLHSIPAENINTVPSLRNPYLKLFISATTTAGTPKAAFVNLYGSSVYIDGGDKGTTLQGGAALESPKTIDSSSRSLLGLYAKPRIGDVDNQKIIYPTYLTAYSSVPARIDLVLRTSSCGGLQFGYGNGTTLSRAASGSIPVIRTGSRTLQITSGTFPDISQELSGSLDYLTGRRVRVVGTGIFATHVTSINGDRTVITTDRDIPATTTSIQLARFNAYALQANAINAATTSGVVLRRDTAGYWRMGLWPQAIGAYDTTKTVAWGASASPRVIFSNQGAVTGEERWPSSRSCNESTFFTITTNPTQNTYTVTFGSRSVSGTGSPFPIALVVEMMDGASVSDVTILEGDYTVPGSGIATGISAFTTLSDVTENSTAAGGTSYLAHKFEDALCDPLSGVLVDRQGYKVMSTTTNRVATLFLAADQTTQFDLSRMFGPDKMWLTLDTNSANTYTALFVVATSRSGTGIASATLNWEEM